MTGTSEAVVRQDLDHICDSLENEFGTMSGARGFISGGAGFLGYYLVQSLLHSNRRTGSNPISVTVCDNFIRGVPDWLVRLREDPSVTLLQHDITAPLPPDVGRFDFFIHA